MPSGAVPVPVNAYSIKSEIGSYKFFFNGWKLEGATRDNCRFGSDRDNVFPEDHAVQLDEEYLKKMGLTKDRMTSCDALFFYQLLIPIAIGDPSRSGIADDPRMGYYEMVSNDKPIYAYGF